MIAVASCMALHGHAVGFFACMHMDSLGVVLSFFRSLGLLTWMVLVHLQIVSTPSFPSSSSGYVLIRSSPLLNMLLCKGRDDGCNIKIGDVRVLGWCLIAVHGVFRIACRLCFSMSLGYPMCLSSAGGDLTAGMLWSRSVWLSNEPVAPFRTGRRCRKRNTSHTRINKCGIKPAEDT
jgi:hypothetical protein